jgi:hypothetical protein
MSHPYIYVSGVGEPLIFNDSARIDADLGLPDSFGQVWIASINASFGFNSTPHTVEMELVSRERITVTEDLIENDCSIQIGELYFMGKIAHIDSSVGTNGFVTRMRCEDNRVRLLNEYLVHTEPLLESNIDKLLVVPQVLGTAGTLYQINSPLYMMSRYGATYAELYQAINTLGIVTLPPPGAIANKLGNQKAYRWAFNLTPLFDAILQVFDDTGYDVYFYNNEIKLIDRSKSIEVDSTFFDGQHKIDYRSGYDNTMRPDSYFILGARKEGGVGTVSGVVQYQNLVSLGATSLSPAWNDITVSYHDSEGRLQTYYPTDDELKMALKSIEHWVYFKRQELEAAGDRVSEGWMESRIDPDAFGLQGSLLESAISFGGGRDDVYRVIHNRRSEKFNWVCAWYEAVARHARTYYGKLYSCRPGENFLRKCEVIDDTWVHDNIDNQVVPDAYSPFYKDGRMSAFAKFSNTQVKGFGPDGTATPLAFTEWNEDDNFIYMPVTVTIHSPTSEKDTLFPGITETRMFVSLPEIIVADIEPHPLLNNLGTMGFVNQYDLSNLATSGSIEDRFQLYLSSKDMNDPRLTMVPLSGVDNFFIPVRYNIRYGDDGSALAGSTSGLYGAEIDEKYAPWTKTNPANPESDMLVKAQKIVGDDTVDDFIEATIVGLPETNFFANFSDENYAPIHPFTSINVTIGSNGLTTRYSAKSQIVELVRANAIEYSRFQSRLSRIQHWANFSKLSSDFNLNIDLSRGGILYVSRPPAGKTITSTIESRKPEEEVVEVEQRNFIKTVEIIDVKQASVADPNGGTSNITMEFYAGKDDKGSYWPANWQEVEDTQSADPGEEEEDKRNIRVVLAGFGVSKTRTKMRKRGFAPCVDGYLRKGMTAQYHHEDIEGTIYTYFTGGIDLADTKYVRMITEVQKDETSGRWYADLETVSQVPNVDPFRFKKVPFLNNDTVAGQSYATGDKVVVVCSKEFKGGSANATADSANVANENQVFPTWEKGIVRPEGDFLDSDGQPNNLMFIDNPNMIAALAVYVVEPPDPITGVGGIVAVVNNPSNQFGKLQGNDSEEGEDLTFVGVSPDVILEGDYGILTKGLSNEWIVIMQKPLFSPYNEFNPSA